MPQYDGIGLIEPVRGDEDGLFDSTDCAGRFASQPKCPSARAARALGPAVEGAAVTQQASVQTSLLLAVHAAAVGAKVPPAGYIDALLVHVPRERTLLHRAEQDADTKKDKKGRRSSV